MSCQYGGSPKANGTQECVCKSNTYIVKAVKSKNNMDCGYFPLGYNYKEEPENVQGSLSPDNYRGRHIYALYSHIYNQLRITFILLKRPALTDLSDIKIKVNNVTYIFKHTATNSYGDATFVCDQIIFKSAGDYYVEFLN